MIRSKSHFYEDVPRLGNVAFTRHAQEGLRHDGVSEDELEKALLNGTDTPDGVRIVWRRYKGIRLVINKKPEPYLGAALVITAYREIRPNRVGK